MGNKSYNIFRTWVRYLIIPLLFFSGVRDQNLVLNPNFEEYDHLPSDRPKLDESFCKHWISDGYVFYFNSASQNPDYSSPYNKFGYYKPSSGIAYIGFGPCFWSYFPNYVTGKLKVPLCKDKTYRVQFRIQFCSLSYTEFALIGAKFTTDSNFISKHVTYDAYGSIGKADIENNDTNFITNDTCWITIGGLYKARGGEKFIVIGTFFHKEIFNKGTEYFFIETTNNMRKIKRFIKRNQNVFMLNPKGHISDILFASPFYFFDDVSVELIE